MKKADTSKKKPSTPPSSIPWKFVGLAVLFLLALTLLFYVTRPSAPLLPLDEEASTAKSEFSAPYKDYRFEPSQDNQPCNERQTLLYYSHLLREMQALLYLQEGFMAGQPFPMAYERLASLIPQESPNYALLKTLSPAMQEGVPDIGRLLTAFHAIPRLVEPTSSALPGENTHSWWHKLRHFFQSQIEIRTPTENTTQHKLNALREKVEQALAKRKYQEALDVLEALPGPMHPQLTAWVHDLKARMQTEAAYFALKAALSAEITRALDARLPEER